MADFLTPVVLSSDGKRHSPLAVGAYLDPRSVPLSTASDNLLYNYTDGLMLDADALVSDTPGNTLVVGLDNKLFAPEPDIAARINELVSAAPDNTLTIIDGKLYVPVQPEDLVALLSDIADNQLRVVDNKFYAPPVDMRMKISADSGNYVRLGADEGVFVDGNDILSNEANNALGISAVDGKVYLPVAEAKDWLSKDAGQLLGLGLDAKIILTKEMLASLFAPSDGFVYGMKNGAWVRLDTELMMIDPEDQLLTVSDAGIKGNASLDYNNTTGVLRLIGKNGIIISEVELQHCCVDYTLTVVDDVLTGAVKIKDRINFTVTLHNAAAGTYEVAWSQSGAGSLVFDQAVTQLDVTGTGQTVTGSVGAVVSSGNAGDTVSAIATIASLSASAPSRPLNIEA